MPASKFFPSQRLKQLGLRRLLLQGTNSVRPQERISLRFASEFSLLEKLVLFGLPMSHPIILVYVFSTSGTTGTPKGALLTHENLVSAIAGVDRIWPMTLNDRHLSYLPLPHIFERVTMAGMYSAGASIAFFRGDPTLLIEDLQACRPTFFPAAPRVLNKIHDKVRLSMIQLVHRRSYAPKGSSYSSSSFCQT